MELKFKTCHFWHWKIDNQTFRKFFRQCSKERPRRGVGPGVKRMRSQNRVNVCNTDGLLSTIAIQGIVCDVWHFGQYGSRIVD